MTNPPGPQDDGGTELAEEEREGLIPSYITLRSELNEAEQANILEAEEWAFARKRDLLEEKFLNKLHKRMYGHVWRWAGQYRTTGKNIGIDAYRIPTELRQLFDDCRYWIANGQAVLRLLLENRLDSNDIRQRGPELGFRTHWWPVVDRTLTTCRQ